MLSIPLMDTTFQELRDYIYEHSGIYIADTKKYLIENRLARFKASLQTEDIDAALLLQNTDLFYFTGNLSIQSTD